MKTTKSSSPWYNGDPWGDDTSLLGTPLNIPVPSETSSFVQITSLPANGTVVLSDGSTPVTVGESLPPAQAAGLRFKPSGAASSSQLDFDEIAPSSSPTRWSIGLLFDVASNSIIPSGPSLVTGNTSDGAPPDDTDRLADAVAPAAAAPLAAASVNASSAAAMNISTPRQTAAAPA